jgi:XTP/dITP diphosphohydrolase
MLLASRNQGKLREFKELLPGMTLIHWPAEAPEIPEDGAFFQDNALQKATFARTWWQEHRPGQLLAGVLADDSGLCVDALWGGPGVLSARFAPGLDPEAKNRRLLALLPAAASRTARFVCVLAWVPQDGAPQTFSGVVEGLLAGEPRGEEGFGYDPIFMPLGHDRTFGELPKEVKQCLSHRARASQAFLDAISGLRPGMA